MTCIHCPFAMTDESAQAQNYGCLPTPTEIVELKRDHNVNWSCHEDSTKLCGGFATYIANDSPQLKLDVKSGNLISADIYLAKGKDVALAAIEWTQQLEDLKAERQILINLLVDMAPDATSFEQQRPK